MEINLLDNSLTVTVYYDSSECDYEDNVCISFFEQCEDEERLFRVGETNIYLTPDEARLLARALESAAADSCGGKKRRRDNNDLRSN